MLLSLVVLSVVAAGQCQYYGRPSVSASAGAFGSGSFAGAGGFAGRPGSFGGGFRPQSGSYGFGSGGSIVFPNHTPHQTLPVRPVRPVSPVRPAVNPGFGGVGGSPGSIVSPGVSQPGGVFPGGVGVSQPGVFPVRPGQNLQGQIPSCRPGSQVDHAVGGSEYHFSWCHDGNRKYTGQEAFGYCARLGQGWRGISIESKAEDDLVSSIIARQNLDYIWTGGLRQGFSFVWPNGRPVTYNNWSRTGLDGLPQPDNREDNNEQCLAVLNNFYNDGIVWHDIGCHHPKPIICEREGFAG